MWGIVISAVCIFKLGFASKFAISKGRDFTPTLTVYQASRNII